MSSEATGLRRSSLSPELAVSTIFRWVSSSGTLVWIILAFGLLSIPTLSYAIDGEHPSLSNLADDIHSSRLPASATGWHIDSDSLALALVAATVLCSVLIWILRRSNRWRKSTRNGLPLLRIHPLAHWPSQGDDARKELSRELHDSVGPLLTAVGLQLSTLRTSPNIPLELRAQLEDVRRLNSDALRQIRDLAMGIRPSLLTDVNVVAALEHQVRQFSRRTGIAASVRADASLDHLPEEHRACIYQCVSEALTNCAKHSRARNIHILVALSEGSVTVQVEDDGVGIERGRYKMGLGLIGMRERVSKLNGKLMVDSHEHGGTSLTFEIPAAGVLA